MGLLDDAIREHLDLKRRRGTDPTEVDRLEREALGPVRRPGHEVGEAPPQSAPGGSAGYVDEGVAEPWPGSSEEPTFAAHGSELAGDEEDDWELPQREPLGGVGVEPEAAPATPVPPVHQEPGPPAPPGDEDSYLDQETVEHDVEAEHAREAAQSPEQEDMLEETPEFLQDAPEHDRLWFEQRPPRDFDLEG